MTDINDFTINPESRVSYKIKPFKELTNFCLGDHVLINNKYLVNFHSYYNKEDQTKFLVFWNETILSYFNIKCANRFFFSNIQELLKYGILIETKRGDLIYA